MSRGSVGALGAVAAAARTVGLGRVLSGARDAVDAVALRANRPPLCVRVDGVAVRGFLRHRSFLADVARPGGTYRELFARTVRPGMTVVDGGAHVGLYTLLAGRVVGPEGHVFSFEPDPYNHRALEHNVRAAGLATVRLSRAALAAAPGRETFHLSRGTIGSSLRRRDDTGSVVSVETTTIDAMLAGLDPSALIVKLNVEGAEPLVLDGTGETLARVEDVTMFVEVNPLGLSLGGYQAEELIEQLEGRGFDVFAIRLSDQALIRLERGADVAKGHVFCVRRGARGPRTGRRSGT